MRIGIDAHFLENDYGGITTFLKGAIKSISEIDKKNKYFLFFKTNEPLTITDYPKHKKNGSTQLSRDDKINKFSIIHWFHSDLPKQLRKYKIDLFFSPNHFLPITKSTSKEIVLVHDLAWRVNPEWKNFSYRKYAQLLQAKSLQRADNIIAISENTKRDVIKYYRIDKEDKIETIYLAADEEFQPRQIDTLESSEINRIRDKHRLPQEFILYIGRIETRKNIQGIIMIMKKLSKKKEFNRLKTLLFGPVDSRGQEYLDSMQSLDNVEYRGFISEKDLPYVYNLSKVFLFPSFYEGFGLSVLEAMQSGVPVLTSNTSSLPEIVGNGAITHDPNDYESFVEDIIRLLRDEEFYGEMKSRGPEQARKFSWERSAIKLIKTFNKT